MQRRHALGGGIVLSTTAWIAPSVLTLDRVGAAVGSSCNETPAVTAADTVFVDPPPSTIQEGTLPYDSNQFTYVFREGGPTTLTSNLRVNRTSAGTNFGGNSNQNAIIPTGTVISSFYVHGDRLDDNGWLTGSLTFACLRIIGLIYRTSELNASAFLQAPGTTYFNAPMESNDKMTLSLATNANSLQWRMRFGGALDGIRVITDCGP